jgi:hypothetical protein
MGWKSTIDVTRHEAINLIHYELQDLKDFSDEALANLLEEVMGGEKHGHNYRIVLDTPANP